jgi:hypothetical protein
MCEMSGSLQFTFDGGICLDVEDDATSIHPDTSIPSPEILTQATAPPQEEPAPAVQP